MLVATLLLCYCQAVTRLFSPRTFEPLLSESDQERLDQIQNTMHRLALQYNLTQSDDDAVTDEEIAQAKQRVDSQFWLYYWAAADGFDLLAEAEEGVECVETGEETYTALNSTSKTFWDLYRGNA